MPNSWFVFEAKPRAEELACEQLRKQDFVTLLPMRVVRRIIRHEFGEIELPVFPGYGFVAFDPANDQWRSINGTRGVKRLFTRDNVPTPLRPREERILLQEYSSGPIRQKAEGAVEPGARVVILEGPFEGHTAVCRRVANGHCSVLLLLFGRLTTARVGTKQVRPIKP